MNRDDFSRRWFLDVAACGAVEIRERGKRKATSGLPVFTTDTREQAESLRVLHCRLERDGSGIYRLNSPPEDIDDLDGVTSLFRSTYPRVAGMSVKHAAQYEREMSRISAKGMRS